MSSRRASIAIPLLSGFLGTAFSAEISTFAGNGKAGFSGDGGKASAAELNQPFGITSGPSSDFYLNSPFFCDTNNHVIRATDRDGNIRTLIGTGKKGYTGDGESYDKVTLNEPYEVRFRPESGDLYWVERMNHVVRKMDPDTGIVTTIAGTGKPGYSGDGGLGKEAMLNEPHSIQFDAEGKNLYICDIKNHCIRALDMATGKIGTFCGTGKPGPTPDGAEIGKQTPLNGPRALEIDPSGNLWMATREGNQIFRLDLKSHRIQHMAGTGAKGFNGNGGPAKDATLSGPKGIAISLEGRWIYFADTESHSIRAIDTSKNPPTLELIAGDGTKGDGPDSGDPLKCRMSRPHGVHVQPGFGFLYIGDSENNKVRMISFDK